MLAYYLSWRVLQGIQGRRVLALTQHFKHHLAAEGVAEQCVGCPAEHMTERVCHVFCGSGQRVGGVQAGDGAGLPVVAEVEQHDAPGASGGVRGRLDGAAGKAAPVSALAQEAVGGRL